MQQPKPVKTLDDVYNFCKDLTADINSYVAMQRYKEEGPCNPEINIYLCLEQVGCKGGISALKQVMEAIEKGRENGTD
jgi:hypothetical protein